MLVWILTRSGIIYLTNRYVKSPIYIYIYIVLLGLVKPELGVIPSDQKNKTFNSENLNFPGKELNVTDITGQ